jgi:hypothetical protein
MSGLVCLEGQVGGMVIGEEHIPTIQVDLLPGIRTSPVPSSDSPGISLAVLSPRSPTHTSAQAR